MGNYRFRLSDMIPNAWFYKLKEMSKTRKKQNKTTKKLLKHNPSSMTSSPSSSSLSISSIAAAAPKPHLSDQRKSYHFTRDLSLNSDSLPKTKIPDQHLPVEPPRKSSRRRRSTKRHRPPPRLVSSSVSAGCSCRATIESVWTKSPEDYTNSPLNRTSTSDNDSVLPEYGSDRGLTPDTFDGMLAWSTPCKCSIDNDVVLDIDDNNNDNNRFDQGFNAEQDHLPPIITRKQEPTKIQRTSAEFSGKNAHGSLSVKVVKEDFLSTTTTTSNSSKSHQHKTTTSPVRRYSPHSSSPGVKLRTNSPRLANRRIQGRKSVSSNSSLGSRRSISESFAVMKSSKDPRKDFRESMVEMIVENNIIASKDLEELLACYLSLNSDEYHELIINVFKQIWFDFLHVRLK